MTAGRHYAQITVRLLIVLCGLFGAAAAEAQELHSRRTPDLNLVYYDKAHEYLSFHLARSFENSLAFHEKLFDYTPTEPVLVLMQDFGDFGHGGTSTVPWNYLSIGIEPFDYVYETMPANERMNWLMHHELVHVVVTDKGADSDLRYRKLFHGKVAPIKENPMSMYYSFLTSPRWYAPRWYEEGIAVFLETWMAGGVGRVLGGYDEMVFRTMVAENAYFFDVVGLESEGTTIDFQVGQNSYLYGTRFMTWLAAQYGPEKLIAWVNRTKGSKRYFASQFKNVYGQSLDDEWRRWISSEHEWQKANLALIRQYPVTAEKPITTETLGSVSRSYYDPASHLLYAAINRPGKPAEIAAIDVVTGRVETLTEVIGPALYFVTSMAFDPRTKKIFYTTDNSQGWRDLNELDLATRRQRRLIKDVRTGDLVVNPVDHSIWGIQHHNGISSLVRIPPPYTAWNTILTLEYGTDLFDIDLAPDGTKISASMIDVSGRQKLVSMNVAALLQGDSSFEVLHEFENNGPENFVFSPDGHYLYGTSYFTGVSNIFRYDFATGKMEAITNAETGLFRPVSFSDNTLLAFRYTTGGFVPVLLPIEVREDINAVNYLGQEVVEKYPIVKSWNAGSPARVDLDKITTYNGPYDAFSQIRLGSVYPVLEGYKDTVAAGLRFNASDPLGLDSIDLTAAYSPDNSLKSDERLHLNFGYSHSPWKVRLKYNATDFYDLFGPTKVSRKGYSAAGSYQKYLVFEKPRTLQYTIGAAYYGDIDTLPDFQNVPAPFDKYATAGGHLDYQNLRRTIGAVDYERGLEWSLGASGSLVNSDFFPRFYGSFDRGIPLPLDHTSLWFRTAAGKSFGERTNSFANFFFGGFGNNWVDYQEVRRYRDLYSFPGIDLDEVGGRQFGKATLELTLPPVRFRKVGVPGLYANWARLAVFGGGLLTDDDQGDFRRKVYDAGAQVDLSLVMFSNLESTFSVGYAKAFQRGGKNSDEVMVSLKLLR
ncbi:MAG: hypothetical protein ABI718_03760 [Acidobacteriota bacterium]